MRPSLKHDAASGLVVLVPLIVTAYTLYWVYAKVASAPVGALPRLIPGLRLLHDASPALARVVVTLAIVGLLLAAFTWIMRTALGAVVESRLDEAANHLPGLRVVYNASKIAMETAVSDDVEFDQPVKLFLWGDTRMTAFRTGRETVDGRTTVYVPASPIIFTGWIVEVDEERLIDVDESIESALIRAISAGFANPNESDGDGTGRASRSRVNAAEE